MGELINIEFNSSDSEYDDPNNVLKDDEHLWLCDCGSNMFFITKHGTKCIECGVFCVDWVDQCE